MKENILSKIQWKQWRGSFLSTLWVAISFSLMLPGEAQAGPLTRLPTYQRLFQKAEKLYRLPPNLLAAIAFIESRHSPWAVYGRHRSRFFSNKKDAIAYIKRLKESGVSNINVGLMQINLGAHKIGDIEKILDPATNIDKGAHLLKRLYRRYGSWERAIKYYHSHLPGHQEDYKARLCQVMARITASTPQEVEHKLVVGFL